MTLTLPLPVTPQSYPVSPGSGAGNIIRVWNLSDTLDRNAGMYSYAAYHDTLSRMAAEHGHLSRVAWGVFSALSPLTTEWQGYTNTRRMLRGQDPATGFRRDIAVARKIIAGADPETVLLGLKTRAFYHCIADPGGSDHVVIDGHMHALWLGQVTPLRSVRSLSAKTYTRIADDFRLVAQVLDVPVTRLQATCWYTWRRIRGLSPAGVNYHVQAELLGG